MRRVPSSASHRLMRCLLIDTLKHWQIRASITLDVDLSTANGLRI